LIDEAISSVAEATERTLVEASSDAAATGLTGARRFDRRVQGQQIGLPRDGVDQFNDVPDAGCGLRQLADAIVGLAGLIHGIARHPRRVLNLTADLVDRRCHFLGGRRHRLHIGGGFLGRRGNHGRELLCAFRGGSERTGRGFQFARSRRYGFDDLADRALEFVRQLVHVGFAPRDGPGLRLLLLSLQLLAGGGVALEHLDRIRHLADLVAPADAGHLNVELAASEIFHGAGHALQRPGNAPRDEHRHCEREHQDQPGRDQGSLGRGPCLRIEVVDIDTGADDPTPWSKADDVGQLRLRLIETRLWPFVGNEACPILLDDVDEVDEQGLPVRILIGREIAAVHLRLHRMHHHARLHVIDPEVIVIAISERRDSCHRPLLRVGGRNVAFLGGCMLVLDDAESQLGKVLQFDLFLLHKARRQFARVEDRNSQQP